MGRVSFEMFFEDQYENVKIFFKKGGNEKEKR